MSSAAARDRAVGCIIVALMGVWAVGSSPLFRWLGSPLCKGDGCYARFEETDIAPPLIDFIV